MGGARKVGEGWGKGAMGAALRQKLRPARLRRGAALWAAAGWACEAEGMEHHHGMEHRHLERLNSLESQRPQRHPKQVVVAASARLGWASLCRLLRLLGSVLLGRRRLLLGRRLEWGVAVL